MTDQTLANDVATDATENDSQAQANKTYTQAEVDAMMARTRSSVENKVKKQYDGLGDPDFLRGLVSEAEQRQQAEQIKRGEFEKTLQELAAKKDSEIQKRDMIIQDYRVNTPLVSAAAKHRSVNPEQVKSLLASNVRLNQDGEVEVVDSKGSVRYTDAGSLLQVEDLVKEFLDTNPHFVQPTPSTTNTQSSHTMNVNNGIDLSKLDMKNPEHRKLYAEARAKGKI